MPLLPCRPPSIVSYALFCTAVLEIKYVYVHVILADIKLISLFPLLLSDLSAGHLAFPRNLIGLFNLLLQFHSIQICGFSSISALLSRMRHESL